MKTIWRLLGFLRKPWKLVLLAVSLGWATTVSWVALISTSAYLISYAALQPSIAELQVAIVGVRFFGISRAVFRYLERLVSHTVTFRLLARMRTWLYKKIEPLVPAGLGDQKSGDLYSRLSGDIETLQEFYVRVVAPPLVAILSSIAVLWFFGRWSSGMTLVLFSFQMLTGVVTPLVVRRVGASSSRDIITGQEALSNLIVDGVQGSADIFAFGLRDQFISDFAARQKRIEIAERKHNILMGVHAALVGWGINLVGFLLLLMAIPMVNQGVLDGRLLAVVVLGALASFEAITPLPTAFQNLEANIQVGERLFELSDRQPLIVEQGEKHLDTTSAGIRIEKLSFAYNHIAGLVLEDLDLYLPQGKKVAVVGPSGAGKSTIINLLMRFWPFEHGEIRINGIDIREYSLEEVRGLFSYVPQNPFIFNASLVENIRIGNPDASMDEVRFAVEKAGLNEFISTLPAGYDTLAGEFGEMLSGGQRQRLALARALVRNAPIYLLDEPTENLDPVTSDFVIGSFLDQLSTKSVLMITHQFYGLEMMDEILVMQGHRVVERGSLDSLLEQRGQFASMLEISKAEIYLD
jgi:thiol reductant ABC exporter CydC subunit